LYSIEFERSAIKDFKRISRVDTVFIKKSLLNFIENFSYSYEQELMKTGKIKKLQGQNKELYRFKLRDYRVIYKKEKEILVIIVINVKSRENSYKKRS